MNTEKKEKEKEKEKEKSSSLPLHMQYNGLGKRKTSVAKVFLKEGSGIFTVNKKSFEDFFSGVINERESVKNPFLLVNLTNQYDVEIHVKGGGLTGQLDAIRLAITKAICTINKDYRQTLKQALLLRRDSRIKERRKYGLKKARKASQYSKR
jgi:small subunit ribosomal protein S9